MALPPILPIVLTLPAPAMPDTRVPNSRGAMIDLIRRRKMVPRIASATPCFGNAAPKPTPANKATMIQVVRDLLFKVCSAPCARRSQSLCGADDRFRSQPASPHYPFGGGLTGEFWKLSRPSTQLDRQLPHSLARRGKDRIRNCRSDRRHAGLSDATGILRARHDVYFDHGRIVDPNDVVPVEVALLHAAFVDRDLPLERGAEAIDDRTAHLLLDDRRIHHVPAVHRGHDPVYSQLALVDRHLGHLR